MLEFSHQNLYNIRIKIMLRLSSCQNQGTFERIVRDRSGVLMRVTFEIVEIDGELKGRVLTVSPFLVIPAKAGILSPASSQVKFFLPAPAKIVSPYFSYTQREAASPFSGLEFLTAVKIRAPSI